jgi:hypothetical protein
MRRDQTKTTLTDLDQTKTTLTDLDQTKTTLTDQDQTKTRPRPRRDQDETEGVGDLRWMRYGDSAAPPPKRCTAAGVIP